MARKSPCRDLDNGDKMYALFGINYDEVQDLLRHGIKTFELSGTDHVTVAMKLRPREKIFITNMGKNDIRSGAEGAMATVKEVKVEYWRTVPREFDEKEVLTARIQVEYVDLARVKKVQNLGAGKGLKVDVESHVMVG
jgi:hypothetical protein